MKKLNQKWAIALATVALSLPLTQAQDQGLGDMMFTAGTVATEPGGQEWVWLQWMATDAALLQDRPMDVYMASGGIGAENTFSLKGRAQQVTDPRSIALLLTHGEALGENLTNLEASVDSLYDGAAPAGSLSLEEKLAALISGSQADPELYQNLVFIGRAHPSVAMAIGQGFACRIPSSGFSTFEIRDHNTSEVIGRLELEGGNPLVLPAPGPIALVPNATPKGNLNIRLRWDIPDDLKRVSLLQFGYNLYRMTQPFAEFKGYNTTPPSSTVIANLVVESQDVVKVNRAPILIDPATATTNTWFAIDDNDGLSGGTPFVDGENYYYFVSALDLLGRDGDLSDGFMTFPCDRFAPSVPHQVRTRTINDFIGGVHTQWVEVSWAHDPADTDTARYYVYRHTGIADMQSNAVSAVANRISGPIVPGPTDTRGYYEDHSLSSNNWSQTYWYSVRAEDNASCGNNLSGNSPPAFGLLRDWEGPPPATGVVITIQGETPTTVYDHQVSPIVLPAPMNVQVACKLDSFPLPIAWAQFGWHWDGYEDLGSETNIIASERIYFPEGVDEVSKNFFLDVVNNPNHSVVTYYCRVGSTLEKMSEWAHTSDEKPSSIFTRFEFKGDISLTSIPIPSGGSTPTPGPHVWGYIPNIVNPILTIPAVVGAETVRVYRRVDNGTRTLIHQGEMDELLGAVVTDYTGGSVNGGTICYYYQLFDEHGNAGPMVFIICIEVAPRVDLPTPVLESIDSSGTATSAPGMTLDWFCTTPGVERFELAIALDETAPAPTFGISGYAVGSTNEIEVVVGGVTNTLSFGFYRTGRVGTTFGLAGSPEFTLDSLASLDRDYTVMVRAIGVAGITGPWSNVETFRWSTVPAVGPQVPWPTREMPVVQSATFHTNLAAVFIDSSYTFALNRVGIRIGEFPASVPVEKIKTFEIQLFGSFKPTDFLYTNAVKSAETMLPCVLYRYQVTNDLYRTVSGDVAQVSPMMEDIAYGISGAITTVYDPFIGITRQSNEEWGVYLIDTQPVVRGAKYQYLLMRFNEETKELDRVIPAGIITIP